MMTGVTPLETDAALQSWQTEFIEYSIHKNVLQFGQFTLKSGRVSPYFFNAGRFDDGESQQKLGEVYANTLMSSGVEFDLVFGPAYKGIPLATSTVYALQHLFQKNVGVAFNRKEKKDHGEGGSLIGAELKGRVVLVDDVITAGTAIRETLAMLQNYPKATLVAAMVLIDRQERLDDSLCSAIQALEKEYGLKILAAVTMEQVMSYLGQHASNQALLAQMKTYREQFGAE